MKGSILRDEYWGWILIALGGATLIYKPFNDLDDALRGAPDRVLTVILILVVVIYLIIALRGSPSLKAIAAFWAITP